ncbi:hypothetical protein O6H91_20G021900 [Diphasiastrum complanatum]|uniref:Uncharacterized protein n=1 Tax=Diphasiastrum complanatum TaxID=34168 RepID=A0ACC2ANC6_DIPCM|nr:hypothetical protein O6H91_20G021900 [Diphasiastrum complanatum]
MRLAILVFVATAALHPQRSLAADEDPIQDFYPAQVQASDFASDSLKKAGNTSNALGVAVTPANVLTFRGLNTQGVSAARIDFAPHGLNPPHVHPRAPEILFLAKGTLLVGFVTSTPDNKLFAQTIKAGELFIFPRGLVHFQLNVGYGAAVAFSASTARIQAPRKLQRRSLPPTHLSMTPC